MATRQGPDSALASLAAEPLIDEATARALSVTLPPADALHPVEPALPVGALLEAVLDNYATSKAPARISQLLLRSCPDASRRPQGEGPSRQSGRLDG